MGTVSNLVALGAVLLFLCLLLLTASKLFIATKQIERIHSAIKRSQEMEKVKLAGEVEKKETTPTA